MCCSHDYRCGLDAELTRDIDIVVAEDLLADLMKRASFAGACCNVITVSGSLRPSSTIRVFEILTDTRTTIRVRCAIPSNTVPDHVSAVARVRSLSRETRGAIRIDACVAKPSVYLLIPRRTSPRSCAIAEYALYPFAPCTPPPG